MSILELGAIFIGCMTVTGCIGRMGPAEDDFAAESVSVVQQGKEAISCPTRTALLDLTTFSSKSRTESLLRKPDSFTMRAGAFDRGARMRTLESTTSEDFLDFLSGHGQAWTADEKAYWFGIAEEVSAAVEGLNVKIPNIFLAKTTGLEEFNAVYTRHNTIFFPRERLVLAGKNRRWDRHLFAHELFHILSNNNRVTRDAIYAVLGFQTFSGMDYPKELEARRITNPNRSGLSYSHYMTVKTPDGPVDVVPIIQSTATLKEIIQLPATGQPAVFAYFGIRLLAVDTNSGEVLRDASGQLIIYDPEDTNWKTLMTRNSDYIIHPDELLADNFAHIVNWRLSGVMPTESWRGFAVNDPELLVAMQDILTAGCEE